MAHTGLKWVAVAAISVLVFVLLTGPSGLASFPDIREFARGNDAGRTQGAAQMSEAEFQRAQDGMSTGALRALVGEPEAQTTNRVEDVRIECWYYGIGGTSGSYQLCFANGKLRSKLRFDP